jgi:hypothetical protein
MPRLHFFLAGAILASATTSCKRPESVNPLVVHVLRNPSASFAGKLRQADLQFTLTNPRLDSGRGMMVATNEGHSFAMLLQRFTDSPTDSPWDILILDSQADLPEAPAIRKQLERAEQVCGQHPAFISTAVSAEVRQASELYLRFLASHCIADKP